MGETFEVCADELPDDCAAYEWKFSGHEDLLGTHDWEPGGQCKLFSAYFAPHITQPPVLWDTDLLVAVRCADCPESTDSQTFISDQCAVDLFPLEPEYHHIIPGGYGEYLATGHP
ncbi:MAG: hypothetical protein AAFR76_14775, partial [Planctomycetota bacterium]